MASSSATSALASTHPRPMFPPGLRFNPEPFEAIKYYLYERIVKGSTPWKDFNLIHESVDILAHPPWELPGMDQEEKQAYYYYKREKKSKATRSKNSNRVMKCKQGHWKLSNTKNVEERGKNHVELWGTKSMLNYYSASSGRTKWLMYEFVLDSKLAENSDSVVLCKVYKKKDGKDEKEEEPTVNANTNAEVLEDILPQPAIKRRRVSPPSTSDNCCYIPPQSTKDYDDGLVDRLIQRAISSHTATAPSKMNCTYDQLPTVPEFCSTETHHIEEMYAAAPFTMNYHDQYLLASSPCNSTPLDYPKVCNPNHLLNSSSSSFPTETTNEQELYQFGSYLNAADLGSILDDILDLDVVDQDSNLMMPHEADDLVDAATIPSTMNCDYQIPAAAFGSTASRDIQETHSEATAPGTVNYCDQYALASSSCNSAILDNPKACSNRLDFYISNRAYMSAGAKY